MDFKRTKTQDPGLSAEPSEFTRERLETFTKSPAGKLAAVGVAVLAVALVGMGAYFFLAGGSDVQSPATAAEAVAPVPAGEALPAESGEPATEGEAAEVPGPSTEAEVTTTAPEPTPLTDVFTFRDIFKPTVKAQKGAPVQQTSGTGVPTGTSTGTQPASTTQAAVVGTSGDNTLYAQDIITQDGEQIAVVVYSGTVYELAEGERVGDSPWQVLAINETSIVMLYGDTKVTVAIGQGISK